MFRLLENARRRVALTAAAAALAVLVVGDAGAASAHASHPNGAIYNTATTAGNSFFGASRENAAVAQLRMLRVATRARTRAEARLAAFLRVARDDRAVANATVAAMALRRAERQTGFEEQGRPHRAQYDLQVGHGDSGLHAAARLASDGGISGHVESADHQPLAGICVTASGAGSGFGVQTGADGNYDIGALSGGQYRVGFSDGCAGHPANYIPQWFDNKPDFAHADLVSVTAGQTSGHVDATMQVGGHISGHVESADHQPLAGICVSASGAGSGFGVQTGADGNYDIGALSGGQYRVGFSDGCAGHPANYIPQWFDNKPDFAHADLVSVTAGQTSGHVDATMQVGGHISGHVESADHQPLAGICVTASGAGSSGFAQTGADGNYDIGALSGGQYRVGFSDGCAGHPANYIPQWFDNKPDFAHADLVSVTAGQTSGHVDATMQVGGHISGHVESADHQPLAGICVTASGAGSSGFAQTGADGNYDIGALSGGQYRVGFSDGCAGHPANYIPQWFDNKPDFAHADLVSVTAGQTSGHVDATMQVGGHISGHVESADHQPLAGICVTASGAGSGFGVQTGADGNYDIGALSGGQYRVGFSDGCAGHPANYIPQWFDNKPDFAHADLVSVTAGQTSGHVDATMQVGGHISGHVESADHQPLAGICVTASGAGSSGFAQTGADGNYDIGALSGGQYRVGFSDGCAGHPANYIPQWFDNKPDFAHADLVSVTAGQTSGHVDATMQVGGHISGHVESADHQPLAGICVTASGAGSSGFAQTGADGNYDIGALSGGQYRVGFSDGCAGHPANYIPQWFDNKPDFAHADLVSVTAGQTSGHVDATMQVGGHISGHVESADHQPLAGICVSASGAGSGFGVQTGADGNYDIGALSGGQYRVGFSDGCAGHPANYIPQWFDNKPDFAHADLVSVTAGQTSGHVDATMQVGGHISGHVESADHQPLAGICVTASGAGSGFGVQTGADGNYDIGALSGGQYRVGFSDGCAGHPANYIPQWFDNKPDFAHADLVSVTAGQTSGHVDATMQVGGHISGHVESADHQPLAGICVTASGAGSGFGVQTGADGNYDIGALSGGQYRVGFSDGCAGHPANYIPQWFDNKPDFAHADLVSVTAGQTSGHVDATMQVGGHISGHVESADHQPLAGICVTASGAGSSGFAQTGADGNYDIGALPTGSHEVRFDDCSNDPAVFASQVYNNKTWFDDPDLVQVNAPDTTSGIDATMHPGGSIGGQVTTAGSHDPVENACVILHRASATHNSDELFDVSTDQTGHYSMSGLPPGSYKVSFSSCPGASHHYRSQWFDGKADGASADRIALAIGQNRGNVDAQMGGSGTAGFLSPGETLSTGLATSSSNPVVVDLTAGSGVTGWATIDEDASITTQPPGGFALFGKQFAIDAPDGTTDHPLTVSFTIDASLMSGIDPSVVSVFRNGSPIANCSGASSATTADPDPCMKSRTTIAGGDLRITILTSHASSWNFGYAAVPPDASTGAATGVTTTGATLNGTANPHGLATTYYFEYGTTTNYGSSTASQAAGSGTGSGSVSTAVSGLLPGTTYHYRLVAVSAGGTGKGSDQTFPTLHTAKTLTLGKAGNGAGSVTSNPAGIDCGSTCSHDFEHGTSVTLTATASAGSTFSGWSGACSGSGTCTLTMDQGRFATATFTLVPLTAKTLTLGKAGNGAGSVTSIPAGIDCGSTCSHDFEHGTSVTLTATASAGSTFSGWSGACSGSGTCTLTMDQGRSATATFTLVPLKPPIRCVVPNVKGKKLAVAKSAIKKHKCKVGKIVRAFSKVKKGLVISQKPAPGKQLREGSKVNLVVSKGRK